MTYLLGAAADAWASFSFCAQSSQQTSTVLPPIVTLMEFASSAQSHAAQVFSAMTSSSEQPNVRVQTGNHAGEEGRFQDL
jgi:hypothetical protein